MFNLEPEERAREGLFLSFQSPIEIPGVSNIDFLRLAVNSKRKSKNLPEMDPLEFYGFVTVSLKNSCIFYHSDSNSSRIEPRTIRSSRGSIFM